MFLKKCHISEFRKNPHSTDGYEHLKTSFLGREKTWLLKPVKEHDRTCQQEPVLGNPLNWLEQIVLEGQTSTAGAHLKETLKIRYNSVVAKGSSKRKHTYKQLLDYTA